MKLLIVLHSMLTLAWATNPSCQDDLFFDLKPGLEYSVCPAKTATPEKDCRRLTFVTAMNLDGSDFAVFSDPDLNLTYYVDGEVNINGRALDITRSQVPKVIKFIQQSGNTCVPCSFAMALGKTEINQAARGGSAAVSLSKSEDQEIMKSSDTIVRDFLDQLYNSAWPKGYSPGLKSALNMQKVLAAINSMKREAQSQIQPDQTRVQQLSKDAEGKPYRIRPSHSVQELILVLKQGDSAVMRGLPRKSLTRRLSIPSIKFDKDVQFSDLQPLRPNLIERVRQMALVIPSTLKIQRVFERLENGERPDAGMVNDFTKVISPWMSHAVAVTDYLSSGPLRDTLVVLNPWGYVELYPVGKIQNGLEFSLIEK